MVKTPEQVAEAIASDTGWQLGDYASERQWGSVGTGPVGQHRDSDALARSNFRVILADLTTRFPGSVEVAHFGHWAVGWVEEISFDASRADVKAAVAEWRGKLEQYPVADEGDWSTLEWEEMHAYLATEIPFQYGALNVLPLSDDGYAAFERLAIEFITESTSSVDDLGDISISVRDAYCEILASDNAPNPDQLTITTEVTQ